MISQTAEHALRAVIHLAQAAGESHRLSAQAIAEAIGAPANYLGKTLQILAKGGVLESVRGPGGGFRLALSPSEIPLSRIVDLFEESRNSRVCLMGGRPCNEGDPCSAHRTWRGLRENARQQLCVTTVADLIGRP